MSTTQIARAALEDLMRRCREDGHNVQYSDLLALQSVLAAAPAQTLLNIRRRVREIEAILARSKSDYFNLGIEKPLKERAALAHLQRRDPLSDDVNALVLTINQLERPI